MTRLAALGALFAVGCTPAPVTDGQPPILDTDSGEPKILPIDTSIFEPPGGSGVGGPIDIVPTNFVFLLQTGTWTLNSASPPYTNLFGTMSYQEYIDELDTALPVYECNVQYSLTGTVVENSSCGECDFVMAVEHYVTSGDPTACHDPDAPTSGTVWEMGLVESRGEVVLNYAGTGVWLDWYDAQKAGSNVALSFEATIAIELEDTGDDN